MKQRNHQPIQPTMTLLGFHPSALQIAASPLKQNEFRVLEVQVRIFAVGLIFGLLTATVSIAAPLSDNFIPLDKSVRVLGPAPADAKIRFSVALKLPGGDSLMRSNAAGIVLTPKELDRYLPTVVDYARVIQWLKSSGFRVEKTWPARLSVHASGTVAQVSKAFATHFSRIALGGGETISADRAPELPETLGQTVLGINGLQPGTAVSHSERPSLSAETGKPPFTAQDFLTAYKGNGVGGNGGNTSTAIIMAAFPAASDVTAYWTATKSHQTLDNVFIETDNESGNFNAANGKETLATEIVGAMAEDASLYLYATGTNGHGDLDTAFQAVLRELQNNDVTYKQMLLPVGACEADTSKSQEKADNNTFAAITALGVTVVAPSGDGGSRACGKSDPASVTEFTASPEVTGVGGTVLTIGSNGGATETAWAGSGGGVSGVFAKPAYQANLTGAKRLVPDVAADASATTPALLIFNGVTSSTGGTEVAAAVVTGLVARLNSDLDAHGEKGIGLLNKRLYTRPDTFRDITQGSNGDYNAGAGYDEVTGLGGMLTNLIDGYLVDVGGPPTITHFSPIKGPVGTTVTIDGTNFTAPLSITFAGNVAASGSFNATEITVTVPVGAETGTIKVTTASGSTRTATPFTVKATAKKRSRWLSLPKILSAGILRPTIESVDDQAR